MAFNLREYQAAAVEAVEAAWTEYDSALLVMATGTGKTEVFTELARRHDGRSLIICPMICLIDQAADKILKRTGEMPAIEQAQRRSRESGMFRSRFIVASKQTLRAEDRRTGVKRYERLQDISRVIVDEAHLSITEDYAEILNHYRRQGAQVLGVTATPHRHDGRGMHNVYETCAYQYDISAGLADGYLVGPRTKTAVVRSLNLSLVGKTNTAYGRDYAPNALASAMEEWEPVAEIAAITADHTQGKKTVIYCASVEQARRVAERLIDKHGISAGWVCADTRKCPEGRRKELLASFTADRHGITHLCNVGILTTGWDFPGLQAIVQARPTESLALYTQIFGRGTRPLHGVVDGPPTPAERKAAIAASAKPDWLMLDLVDTAEAHKLRTSHDVLAGRYGLAVAQRAKAEADEDTDLESAMQAAAAAIEAEEKEKQRQQQEIDEMRRLGRQLEAEVDYRLRDVDPFDGAGSAPPKPKVSSGPRWPFGKHAGRPMDQVPTGYLRHFADKVGSEWLRKAIAKELRRRSSAAAPRPAKPWSAEDINDINRLLWEASHR